VQVLVVAQPIQQQQPQQPDNPKDIVIKTASNILGAATGALNKGINFIKQAQQKNDDN